MKKTLSLTSIAFLSAALCGSECGAQTWTNLGSGINGQSPDVSALAFGSNGQLYAVGYFTNAGGVSANCIAKWNGTSWTNLGSGINAQWPGVPALACGNNGQVYAGGYFTNAGGIAVNDIAKWDDTSWTNLGSGMNATVLALACDSNGQLYAGGGFTNAGGVTANRIAKWDGTSWTNLGSGINSYVFALACDTNGQLYAGGAYFTNAGGVTANSIAKWDGTSWTNLGSGMHDKVLALACDNDGRLYAGGWFTNAGGVTANRIAKWDGTSWTNLGSGMSGSLFYSAVNALACDTNGNLYAGGSFTNAGGVMVNNIAKWDGTSWTNLGSGMNGSVSSLVVCADGYLYAGGNFTTAGGVAANRIAKWHIPSGVIKISPSSLSYTATYGGANPALQVFVVSNQGFSEFTFTNTVSYSAGASGWLNPSMLSGTVAEHGSLAVTASVNIAGLSAGTYMATNTISSPAAANSPQTLVATLTINDSPGSQGQSWTNLGSGMNSLVNALACDTNGQLYAGGGFTTAGGVAVKKIAKWDGTSWTNLGSGMMTYTQVWYQGVYALAYDINGQLYAGGYFTNAGDVTANYIAKWDGTSWTNLGSGMNWYVKTLAFDNNGRLYAGGWFNTAGGVAANSVAKWDGRSWTNLGSGINYWVNALACDTSGQLYAGGYFTNAGGVSANRIAKWDGTSWANLGNGMSHEVYALACDTAGQLYAGGEFTNAGGISANYIAKWNGTSWTNLGSGMSSYVKALAFDTAGQLYAGGDFTTAGGVPANYIAKWDGTSWTNLGSGMNGSVSSLVVCADGYLYAGGSFTTASGVPANYVAKWSLSGAIRISPSSLSYTAAYGGANPASQVFVVSNQGPLEFTFTNTVSYSAGASGWFNPSILTGAIAGHGSLAVAASVNIAGLSAGTYMATNTISSPTAANSPQKLVATLTVNYSPVIITMNPQSLTNNPGQSATFSVQASGTAPLSYQWQKDGTNISGATSTNYTIASVTKTNEGGYCCVVANLAGSATSSVASLTVNDPPAITSQPASLTNDPGSSAIFTVVASGSAPLYYQWQKNNINIGGATTANYTIASVAETDEGNYRCIVTNMAGSATSLAASLTVNDPPAAPTGVAASDGTYTNKIRISWAAVSNATAYEVWRNTSDTTNSVTKLGDTADTGYDDTGMPADTTYYYWVKAKTATQTSAFSASDSGWVATSVSLPTPTGVSASDGEFADKVQLTWLQLSAATHYQVWRNTANNVSGGAQLAEIAGSDNTSYEDISANIDVIYYYWIRAKTVTAHGQEFLSKFSNSEMGYRAPSTSTLDPPSGLAASDGTYTNKVRVAWNLVTGAGMYEVWRNTINSIGYAAILSTTTNLNYDDTNVTANITYYYWVRARNPIAASTFSMPDVGFAAPVTGTGSADLTALNLVFLPGVLGVGDHPGAVSLMLINYGPDSVVTPNARVGIDFYLSGNTNFGDTDDIWFGNYSDDVALGVSSYLTLPFSAVARQDLTIPAVAAGAYNVFATVRHESPSMLADPDLGNNSVVRVGAIAVTSSGPGPGYHLINDYDGDGKSDVALYKESTGEWLIVLSGAGEAPVQFAMCGKDYQPVIADYDGDGKADPAVCSQKTGEWKAMLSASGYSTVTFDFGGHTDMPVPIDYDGDGKADPAIYRPSGAWVMKLSGSGYAEQTLTLGGNAYVPVPADYDGDGISDLAVYRLSTGEWMLKLSTLDYWTVTFRFEGSGAMPVPADYDGDGKADPAIYKEASGDWSIMMSRYGYLTAGVSFGGHGWVPVEADYDGDGKEDIAIYNDNHHLLKVLLSGSGYEQITLDVGGPGCEPVGWPR